MAIAFISKVLLTVLKVLLFLLLFILVLLALVLFVPIRYKIYAERELDIFVNGKIKWLLGIVYVLFSYKDGKADYKLRIFGADYNKLKGLFKREIKKGEEYFEFETDADLEAMELTDNNSNKKARDDKSKSDISNSEKANKNSHYQKKNNDEAANKNSHYQEKNNDEAANKNSYYQEKNNDEAANKNSYYQENSNENNIKKGIDASGSINSNFIDTNEELSELYNNNINKNRKQGFKKAIEKIIKIPETIRDKIRSFSELIKKVINSVKDGAEKVSRVKQFIFSENTKSTICVVMNNVLHLIKKIKPRKLKSEILFGTGDPCSTGEALGIAAAFMAATGFLINITPDFENKVIQGNIEVSGRIRIFTLAWAAFRVIMSKQWKNFYKEAMKIKEEL